MWEQAVFGYFLPRQKVTRRKGGKVNKRHPGKWIFTRFESQKPKAKSQSQKPKAQSVVLMGLGISICQGDADSPFRPYGGSLFGKRPKK